MKKYLSKILTIFMAFLMLTTVILPTHNIYAAEKDPQEEDKPSFVEHAISWFFLTGSLGTYALISITAQQPITIESLIFNKYPNTRLTFFKNMGDFDGTPGPDGQNPFLLSNKIISEDGGIIDDIFSFLRSLSLVFYMIILVYMAIRIMLGAGTEKNAKYKELILYWIQGVCIIFFFPYVIKYTIMINDAFVNFIYENKNNLTALGDQIDVIQGTAVDATSGNMSQLDGTMSTLSGSLLDNASKPSPDYFSDMFSKAWNDGWLVYTICWCTMVMQLLSLFIIYIKRMLITIFLIVTFPLVSVSYAIDKIGDGKSQAFNNWYKEFVVNVFLQTFHAIIYVIGMAIILAIGSLSGSPNDNWILIILVITFISNGDEILKGIFNIQGGGGDTVKGIGKTMLMARGVKELLGGARNLVNDKFGENSRLGQLGQNINNFRDVNRRIALNNANTRAAMLNEQISQSAPATTPSPVPVPIMAPASQTTAPTTSPQDLAKTALDANATDEEREKALNQLADIYENDSNAWKSIEDSLKDDQESLNELKEMIKIQAAINGIMIGVNLKENIELLIRARKSGKYKSVQNLAQKFNNYSDADLQRMLYMVGDNGPKFKKPEKTKKLKKKVYTRNLAVRSGERYANGMGYIPEVKKQKKYKQKLNRVYSKVTLKLAKPISMGKNAISRANSLRRNSSRLLRDRGQIKLSAANAINRAKTKTKAKLTGIKTSAISTARAATSRVMGATSRVVGTGRAAVNFAKGTVLHPVQTGKKIARGAANAASSTVKKVGGKIYSAADSAVLSKMRDVSEVKKAVKKSRELREKQYLNSGERRQLEAFEKFISTRANSTSKVFNKRIGGKLTIRRGKMSMAQRIANREVNRRSVEFARQAIDSRKQATIYRNKGDIATANKLEQEAATLERVVASTRRTSFRKYDLDNLAGRRMTKSQKMLEKSTVKIVKSLRNNVASIEKELKVARRANDTASTQEIIERLKVARAEQLRVLNSIRQTRAILRENGVKLKLANKSEHIIVVDLEKANERVKKAERYASLKDSREAIKQNNANSKAEREKTIELLEKSKVIPIKVIAERLNKSKYNKQKNQNQSGAVLKAIKNELKRENEKQNIAEDKDIIQGIVEEAGMHTKQSAVSRVTEATRAAVTSIPTAISSSLDRASNAIVSQAVNKAKLSPSVMAMARAENFRKEENKRVISGITNAYSEEKKAPEFDPESSTPPIIRVREDDKDSSNTSSNSTGYVVELNTTEEKKKVFNYMDSLDKSEKGLSETKAMSLAAAVVTINGAMEGAYTAKDSLSAIDMIRSIQSKITDKESQEYKDMQTLLANLQYNLDDFEANLRIQILNDPTLLSSDDSSKNRIIDDSIAYVKKLPKDDILLTMLNYDTKDLEVGYTPVVAHVQPQTKVQNETAREDTLQDRLRRIQEENEMNNKELARVRNNELKGAAVNLAALVADAAIVTPITIATGATASGLGSGSNSFLSSAVAGVTTATQIDKTGTRIENWTVNNVYNSEKTRKLLSQKPTVTGAMSDALQRNRATLTKEQKARTRKKG